MNDHITQSGKRIDPTGKAHSVPTSIRKATTFLNDEYLKVSPQQATKTTFISGLTAITAFGRMMPHTT